VLSAITVEHDDEARVVVLRLIGDHDLATARTLSEALRDTASCHACVIDLTDCTFVDSSIIVVLLQAAGHRRVALQIPGETPARRALEIAGVDRLVPAAPSREEAIRVATTCSGRLARTRPGRPGRSPVRAATGRVTG
jgi:anti-anti-sigma factor